MHRQNTVQRVQIDENWNCVYVWQIISSRSFLDQSSKQPAPKVFLFTCNAQRSAFCCCCISSVTLTTSVRFFFYDYLRDCVRCNGSNNNEWREKNASSYQNESVWITFIKWQTQFEIIAFLVLEQVFLSWFTLIKGIRQQLQLRLHNKIQHSNQTQMLNFEVVVCAAHVPAGRRAARVDVRLFFLATRFPFHWREDLLQWVLMLMNI